jgi:hypothetical protein
MKTDEQKQFIIMQENIKALQSDVQEIKGDVKTLVDKQEEKHEQLMQHFSATTAKIAVEFGEKLKELDNKKPDRTESWAEPALKWALGILGTGAILYALRVILAHGGAIQ